MTVLGRRLWLRAGLQRAAPDYPQMAATFNLQRKFDDNKPRPIVLLVVVYFREVQRPWVWVLLLFAMSTPTIVLFLSLHPASGHQGPSDRVLYLAGGLPALLALWFSVARLIVEVRETELSIHFFLLWPERIIEWSQIREAKAALSPASGLGVRRGVNSMVYRVYGNLGVRIDLRNGETAFVGSQRAYELADAITERLASASSM